MIIALHISIALNLIALGLIYWLRKEQKTNFSLHESDLEAARHAYEALMSDLSNYQVEIHKKIVELEKQHKIKTEQLVRNHTKLVKDLPKDIKNVISNIQFARPTNK